MDKPTRTSVARALLAAASALEADFASTPHKKNQWLRLTVQDLRADPSLAEELLRLMQEAYAGIGGHAKIKTPKDLMDEVRYFDVVDFDKDDSADAVQFSDQKPGGEKGVGLGHDGSRPAKDVVIRHQADSLRQRGTFAEVSGPLAHVLLTKFDVPTVTDEATVRKVLAGKNIEWIGPHPEGKYPTHPGWYNRDIGGHKHMKILVGEPLA